MENKVGWIWSKGEETGLKGREKRKGRKDGAIDRRKIV